MPDADDQNRQIFVKRFVDDAVSPHAKSTQPPELPLESGARRGFPSETVDRRDEPRSL